MDPHEPESEGGRVSEPESQGESPREGREAHSAGPKPSFLPQSPLLEPSEACSGGRPAPLEPRFLLGIAGVVEGGLVLLAFGLGWGLGEDIWTKIHWNVQDALGGVVLVAPLWLGLWLGVNYPWGPWRGLVQVLEEWVVPVFARCRLWHLGGISLLAGLGEEMLFRGVLQDAALRWFTERVGEGWAGWLTIGILSTVFGLLHWISPFYALLAGLIGAYLGWWRIYSGNLLGPIVAHGLYDFVALVYLTRFWRRR